MLPGRQSPPWSGIAFSTALAVGLILVVRLVLDEETISALGGTTALLLLAVFGLVNIAVLVLRKDRVDADHYITPPTVLPFIGAFTTFFLVGPWAQDTRNYVIAGALLGIGLVLFVATYLYNGAIRARRTRFRDYDR